MRVSEKKHEKRLRILEAAYQLFIAKSVQSTAVDEVVQRAGVAKGTFYLYFKDKYDLVDQIVVHKCLDALKTGWRLLVEKRDAAPMAFTDQVVFLVSCFVDSMEKDRELLALMNRNLLISVKAMLAPGNLDLVPMLDDLRESYIQRGHTPREAVQTLYLVADLVVSVCCNAIVHQQPFSMQEMRPILFASVKKLLN